MAADGPRPHKPTDIERCMETRAIVEEIDWPCTVHTFFRPHNRGCGRGPAEAITWFFEHVDAGIILEDDCLPDQSFFPYCQILLDKYRHNDSVYMITGTNALKKWTRRRESYFFSYMGHSLGWASWRRAWDMFDYSMHDWGTESGRQKIKETLAQPTYFKHFSSEFRKCQLNLPDDV
ncbi:glycosyltransferase family 2 protein, partial [Nostoc sp. CHAB 5834]|nr:glycosyltransferase family 2 protein [Nostoc sp. CHAB 5834]